MRVVLLGAMVVSAAAVASREEREGCPYWQAVGVLSDHIELACGGEEGSIQLDPVRAESVALACCPGAYGRCTKKERVAGCDVLIAPILTEKSATASKEAWVEALQRARGALVEANTMCSVLAREEPYASCNGKKFEGRDDIYCEMMLFQTEQLGDGNPQQYDQIKCPFPGQSVQDAGRKKGGEMVRELEMSEVPDSWERENQEL